MKVLCCGVVITDGSFVLGCIPYGRPTKLDLPKGHINPNELEIDCALREALEETGLQLPKKDLDYIDKFHYTDKKDLTLFIYRVQGKLPETKQMVCNTKFDFSGTMQPEMIGHRWVKVSELQDFYPKLQPILKQVFKKVGIL